VSIKAFVPANDDEMPVDVEFAPRVVGLLAPDRAQGLANDWMDRPEKNERLAGTNARH
jgi:hypothetical protein